MPTIVKLQKKQKPSSGRTETDIRKLRQKAYQNTAWRKERDNFLREHPLCEKCLEKGKITPAQDIHHKKSPFKNGEINWNLLYDVNNLMSLCKECHGNIHAAQQGHIPVEQIIKQLDDLFNENIPDEDLE